MVPGDKNVPSDGRIPLPSGDERPILVSACLAGRACRYDGSSNKAEGVAGLVAAGQPVAVCPEVAGGLSTPRPPAEIVGGTGEDVLAGRARVVTRDGDDVTSQYVEGARRALAAAQAAGARAAILKARSPSCGSGRVRDGSFSGGLVAGDGVTAALLRSHGITVLSEEDL